MASDGEAAVVGFNDAVDKLQDFTKNADAIEKTVATLQSGTDGARLFDAMAIAVEMLSGRPQPSADTPGRRRVLVVMSDSVDSGSQAKLGEVLRHAQLANVTIYSVGLSTTRAQLQSASKGSQPRSSAPPGTFPLPPQPGVIQTPTTEAQRAGNIDLLAAAVWIVQHVNERVSGNVMEVAAAATGGMHLSTYKDRSIENAIDEIGGELHSQYSISYAPTDGNDLGYHEIKVQVNRKGLRVRTRPGYYVAPPES
jgi:VWFA-related protein